MRLAIILKLHCAATGLKSSDRTDCSRASGAVYAPNLLYCQPSLPNKESPTSLLETKVRCMPNYPSEVAMSCLKISDAFFNMVFISSTQTQNYTCLVSLVGPDGPANAYY